MLFAQGKGQVGEAVKKNTIAYLSEFACVHACTTSSNVAAGLASRMFSRMLPEKSDGLCSTIPI